MENNENNRDPHLWEIAERRAGFKKHLASYVGMNAFFWIIWFFSGWRYSYTGIPWPLWATMWWGAGLVYHFLGAYVFHRPNSAEREYEKLKQQAEAGSRT